MLGDNNDDAPLTFGDIPTIARAILEKTSREAPTDFIQFGTVTNIVATATSAVPFCDVAMDGDPTGHSVTVASLMGASLTSGMRVAVIFDKPHGAYIIGTPSRGGIPLARGSFGRADQTTTGGDTGVDCAAQSAPGAAPASGTLGAEYTVQWCCSEIEAGGAMVSPSALVAGPAGIYAYNIEIPYSYTYPYYAAEVIRPDDTIQLNNVAPTEIEWLFEDGVFDYDNFDHDTNTPILGRIMHRSYGFMEVTASIQFFATDPADSIWVWMEERDAAGTLFATFQAEGVVTFNSAGFGSVHISAFNWFRPGHTLSCWAMDATGAPIGVVTTCPADAHNDSFKSNMRMKRIDGPELYFTGSVFTSAGAFVAKCAFSSHVDLEGTSVLSGIVPMNTGDRFVVRTQHDCAGAVTLGRTPATGTGWILPTPEGASGSIHWIAPVATMDQCLTPGGS